MRGEVRVQGRNRKGMGCLYHLKHLDWPRVSLSSKALSQCCVRDTTLECQGMVSRKFNAALPSSESGSYFDLSAWISEYFEHYFVGGVLGPKCIQ